MVTNFRDLAGLGLKKYHNDYLFLKEEVIGLIAATLEGSAEGTIKAISTLNKKDKVITLIDEIFSEGFFNYFHTTYGTDNMNLNEEMIKDISDKVKELKRKVILLK